MHEKDTIKQVFYKWRVFELNLRPYYPGVPVSEMGRSKLSRITGSLLYLQHGEM